MSRDHVPFEQADKAVDYFKTNAEEYGELVAKCKYLEHKRNVIRKQKELESTKKTVSERQAEAETGKEYLEILEDIQNAWAKKTTLETYMKAAEMTFDLYRSSNKWGGSL